MMGKVASGEVAKPTNGESVWSVIIVSFLCLQAEPHRTAHWTVDPLAHLSEQQLAAPASNRLNQPTAHPSLSGICNLRRSFGAAALVSDLAEGDDGDEEEAQGSQPNERRAFRISMIARERGLLGRGNCES
jgi:hypothetical protein